MNTDKISVRQLVEFILRGGDIDNRTGGMPDKEAMQMGSKIHRKIQGRMGEEYQAEVSLKREFDCGDFSILLEGRADGIITTDRGVTIDEIKGILRSLDYVEEAVPVHLAQAKCYAYIYATDHDLEQISVRMTYVNMETEELKYFHFHYELAELEEWFNGVMEEYKKWAKFRFDWVARRDASIGEIHFPFEYRPGQKKLVSAVYRTINQNKTLFIQAPTGTGKTLSTVYPSLRAMAEGMGDKLFYLTAKTIARTVAEDTFSMLRKQQLAFKTVTLTAKERICKCETPECNPESCPYAKGHFDRVNDAVFSLLQEHDSFTREIIEEAADRFMVCPFELSLDISNWVDGIIGDYNYVFHPRSSLKRYFSEGIKGDYIFLIDEVHNLVERGRDMYSASLVKEDILEVKRLVKGKSRKLSGALERVNRKMLEMKRECDDIRKLTTLDTFPAAVLNLASAMQEYLDEQPDPETVEKVRDLYFRVLTFLDICDRLDDCYVIYTQIMGDGSFCLKLYCVDPSVNLQSCLDKARSSIMFSATLLPIDYYMSLLSTKTDNYAVYAHSCFDSSNLKVLIGADTSTVYARRTPQMYRQIAGHILEATAAKKGNYMVFFSSYKMLEDTAQMLEELLLERNISYTETELSELSAAEEETENTADRADEGKGTPTYRLLRQRTGMKEPEREAFLGEFDKAGDSSLIGLCVMGSIFGEGIDLRGSRLIGALIVGTGLPQVSKEQELLKQYYDNKGMDGFRYAYLCPGMNKVLQAAGRVIRTEEDEGTVVLLDERFTRMQYRSMFPREWTDTQICNAGNVQKLLQEFWNRD